jgi:hypothetical protein
VIQCNLSFVLVSKGRLALQQRVLKICPLDADGLLIDHAQTLRVRVPRQRETGRVTDQAFYFCAGEVLRSGGELGQSLQCFLWNNYKYMSDFKI